MNWYYICKSDILTSYRILIDRIRKHPITTLFFILLAIIGTRLAIQIGLYLDNADLGDESLYIERWGISIIFFSLIFGKVTLYTYRKVLKEHEMLTLFSQPVPLGQITFGKYIANTVYISVLLFTGLFLMYGWLIIVLGPLGIPLDILAEGILLTLLGLSLGFTLPIFLQIKPLSKKVLNLFGNIILIGVLSIPVRFFPRDAGFFIILTILTLFSFAQVYYARKYLIIAWTEQISKPFKFLSQFENDRLFTESADRPLITREAWLISKKELISLLREKDALITLIAAVFLSVASVGVYFYYGSEGLRGSSIGGYFYPGILALFLFLGTLLICALIGLAMISMEGRALYIVKLLPISDLDVLKGKSFALLIIGFPIIIPMSILLPVVAKFPLPVTIFYILLSIVLIISFTGIGIWGGTRFPNFDRTARNMPDLISQFFIICVCAICTFFIGGIPAYLMTINHFIGLLAILIALGWSITIFICMLNRGQIGYDEIGAEMYM